MGTLTEDMYIPAPHPPRPAHLLAFEAVHQEVVVALLALGHLALCLFELVCQRSSGSHFAHGP